jgi:putative oxidoreductase
MIRDEIEIVWAPRVLSILRIIAGLVLWQHGIQKLLHFPNATAPGPAFGSLIWFAGALELLLPPLLILVFFYLAFAGGGPWSLDAILWRSRERQIEPTPR